MLETGAPPKTQPRLDLASGLLNMLALMCTQAVAAGPRSGPNIELKGDYYEISSDDGGYLQEYAKCLSENILNPVSRL
jgi:hypothetical protein